ncbi:unnamed protein product [Cylicocyclus nassatus]|uniref:Peptidase M13 C-terminal domain-containing protein n=1 Tax=Cylicocyclus nassatus TaxID=53992 RepID=A0AA36H7S7_CYLNA|nr:unnamed protein product [Cylicocyclus nassatus]
MRGRMRFGLLTRFILPVGTVMSIQHFCGKNSPLVGNTSGYDEVAQIFDDRLYDVEAHPCEDFYHFACGKYNMNAKKDFLLKLLENTLATLEGLLTDESGIQSKAFNLSKHYYMSCLRNHKEWESHTGYIQTVIGKIRNFGYFPLIDANISYYNRSNYERDLVDLLIYFNKNGLTTEFLMPMFSFRDNDTTIMQFSSRIAYTFHQNLKLAIALCIRTNSTCYLQKLLKDVANMCFLALYIDDHLFMADLQPTTLGKLNESYSSVDLFKYLADISPLEVRHLFQDTLLVEAPPLETIKRFDAELKRIPKIVIVNTIISHFVFNSYRHLDVRFHTLSTRGNESGELIKFDLKKLTESSCFLKTQEKFGQALLASYASAADGHETQKVMQKIYNHLKDAFIEMINEKHHWSSKIKERFLKKMEKMGINLGFTDVAVGNLEDLDKLYFKYLRVENVYGLHFSDMEDIFNRISLVYDFATLHNITAAEDHRKRIEDIFLDVLNAFYKATVNSLVISPTLLQLPLYSPRFPRFYKFGCVGFVIAHEFMHAFGKHAMRNEYGKLDNSLPEDFLRKHILNMALMQTMYEEPLKKLGYSEDKMHRTTEENFADTQGMKLIYKAYQNAKKEGPEPRLKSIPYFSEDQLFFLATAQFWCAPIKKIVTREMFLQDQFDSHSPDVLRVNVVLGNMPEFSKAFHCAPNTPMNSAVQRHQVFL